MPKRRQNARGIAKEKVSSHHADEDKPIGALQETIIPAQPAESSSVMTSWTNRTMDVLRGHATARGIPKRLCDETVKHGVRMLSRQSKSTEGTRHLRLDAWYYIRCVQFPDIRDALYESERGLLPMIRKEMLSESVYHVVIRGNDPKFMPPGDHGADVVTTYFCEGLQDIYDEVDKYLFDELDNPVEIKKAMSDCAFDSLLEAYFKAGDTNIERDFHIVARLRNNNNLLFTCIKNDCIQTLLLLLEDYTAESNRSTLWRVLAEPLRGVGKFNITAFHRAVFDGRPECLSALLKWASLHKHDITHLRNVEERSDTRQPLVELTCLEFAEKVGNYECYNLLAPVFGVPLHSEASDEATREERLALSTAPVVLVIANDEELARNPINEPAWTNVCAVVERMLEGLTVSREAVEVHVNNIDFTDELDVTCAHKLLEAARHLGPKVTWVHCA